MIEGLAVFPTPIEGYIFCKILWLGGELWGKNEKWGSEEKEEKSGKEKGERKRRKGKGGV